MWSVFKDIMLSVTALRIKVLHACLAHPPPSLINPMDSSDVYHVQFVIQVSPVYH